MGKMSIEIKDDAEELLREQGPAPAALLFQVPAAAKSVEEQISYVPVAASLQEAAPPSMAERTVQIGGAWTSPGQDLQNPVSVRLNIGFCPRLSGCTCLGVDALV